MPFPALSTRTHRHFKGIAALSPDYFALVMATGIVSLAVHIFDYPVIAQILFYLNIVAYLVLCALFGAQKLFYWKRFRSHVFNLEKNMGFLSFVAANCILGSQFIILNNNYTLASLLFGIGLLSWIFLIYFLFAVHIEKRFKPSIKVISGTWLLIIVATQSISILGVQLSGQLPVSFEGILFFSLMLFFVGCLFYIVLITLIIYRLLFFKVRPKTLGTPYWISMGADAITVLSGVGLISRTQQWSFLEELLPFLKGMVLLFWAIGTWWIPLMVLLGIWRHLVKKIPISYVSHYWGMVFPLGMYTVCTVKLSQVMELPFLMPIPTVFLYIALGAWILVFMGMLSTFLRNFSPK
ncbi:tellurite resistance/C4-dicarboxylate transporter family protein [Aequorivita todarodis]|uniref:tellurite resistance/C4-dicarboxylate transporter family protein n=1 Tax=Aequorivita todarodis TaxID=2036821 RepID=UPI002350CF5C|nr:tellurite resistance/C4-dicarboxylate transporter family protein [Aequorivita todarodis]MDC8001500.1 tellurite resistance/C4-dicarboxylate transporter family protein [Aequorivita todarodis]